MVVEHLEVLRIINDKALLLHFTEEKPNILEIQYDVTSNLPTVPLVHA